MITFFASYFIWIMFLGLFVLWVVDGRIKKEQALHALIASLIVWVVTHMIKGFFPVARPFVENGNAVGTFTVPQSASFPSTHSAAAMSIAVTIWLHDKKVGSVYLLAGLLVGVARILANVHYPIDIVAGGIIGILTGFSVEKLHVYKLLTKKRK